VEVTRDGAPAPGAEVRLYRQGAVDPNTSKTDWRLAGSAVTGADGAAQLPAAPGRYLVAARAAGRAAALAGVTRPRQEAVTRVKVELPRGHVLNGRVVVARTREPVPLAEVTVEAFPHEELSSPSGGPPEERVTVRADPRGAFRVAGLGPGDHTVTATAPGFTPVESGVSLPRPEDLVLQMSPAGLVEGFVLASDGKPAAGAEVTLTYDDEPVVVMTGAGGGFSAEVGGGTYRISARRGGEAGALAAPVAVAPGARVRGLTIRMGRAATIAGEVVQARGGEPVAGARVDVSPYLQAGDSGRAVTSADGRFSVSGLAPGPYDVVVSAEGLSSSLDRGITLANGDVYRLRVELEGTGAVGGMVRDGAGLPVAGALITYEQDDLDSPPVSVRTGADGRYRLESIPAGETVVVARAGEGGVEMRVRVEVVADATAQADFTLEETGRVEGRVVSRSGGPLTGEATVRLVRNGRVEMVSVKAGPGGEFEMEALPGDYRAMATIADPGSGGRRGFGSSAVRVEPGKTVRVEIRVDEAPAGQSTEVLVLEPNGMPSPGATLWLLNPSGRPFAGARADETGRARVSTGQTVPEGTRIYAWNGGRTAEAPFQPGVETTVQLRPAAALHGKVLGGSRPVQGFTVEVHPDEQRPGGSDVLAFAQDEFLLPDLAPGTTVVEVQTPDGRRAAATVKLQPGATAEVTIPMDGSGVVRARVVDRSGQPIRRALVMVADTNRVIGRSGDDGRVQITSLGTGSHELRFFAPGQGDARRSVSLLSGRDVDLGDVVLASPGG
jgi:hypothetical protein